MIFYEFGLYLTLDIYINSYIIYISWGERLAAVTNTFLEYKMQYFDDQSDPLEVAKGAVHQLRRQDVSRQHGWVQFVDVKHYLLDHPVTGMRELGISDEELERWEIDYR